MAPGVGNSIDLNLSSVATHWVTVEWIRDNVILNPGPRAGRALRLNVALPNGGRVVLFMDVNSHYVMGFEGRDGIYLLADPHRDAFRQRLIDAGLASGARIDDLRLRADHNTLNTLNERFSMIDLINAARLSQWSSTDSPEESVRRPISLLVCMIAECSRLRSVQSAFRNLYEQQGWHIRVDEAIQSWQDAVLVTQLAHETFPIYPTHAAVEKLAKRAEELRALLAEILASAGHSNNRRATVQQLIDGALQVPAAVAPQAQRFAHMARELHIATADRLQAVMTACMNAVAIQAARDGVTAPPLDLA